MTALNQSDLFQTNSFGFFLLKLLSCPSTCPDWRTDSGYRKSSLPGSQTTSRHFWGWAQGRKPAQWKLLINQTYTEDALIPPGAAPYTGSPQLLSGSSLSKDTVAPASTPALVWAALSPWVGHIALSWFWNYTTCLTGLPRSGNHHKMPKSPKFSHLAGLGSWVESRAAFPSGSPRKGHVWPHCESSKGFTLPCNQIFLWCQPEPCEGVGNISTAFTSSHLRILDLTLLCFKKYLFYRIGLFLLLGDVHDSNTAEI